MYSLKNFNKFKYSRNHNPEQDAAVEDYRAPSWRLLLGNEFCAISIDECCLFKNLRRWN